MNSATLVIHHAATAMMTVQVHAPHVELKMTNSCCSCTRVSAWHPVRVASLQTLETMNANFVMAPVEVVLVLHHLSASLVIREGFFSVVVLVSVSYIALKASIQNHLIELALPACLPANNAILWIQINASVVLQGNSCTIINVFLETIVQWVPMQTPPLKPVKIAL